MGCVCVVVVVVVVVVFFVVVVVVSAAFVLVVSFSRDVAEHFGCRRKFTSYSHLLAGRPRFQYRFCSVDTAGTRKTKKEMQREGGDGIVQVGGEWRWVEEWAEVVWRGR